MKHHISNKSSKEETVLSKAKKYYETACKNQMYITHRELMHECYNFYDGIQHTQEEENALKKRLQPIVTVNKIKPYINNLIGNEIQTRFRVAFKARTNDPATTRKADGLTHLAYYIQEKNDVSYHQTKKFKDCLITGLGWSQIEKVGSKYIYEWVHPTEMVFDPEDLTPQFNNASFVCRVKWLKIADALAHFPHKAKELKELENKYSSYNTAGAISGEVADRFLNSGISYFDTQGSSGTRIRIVEVQYKEQAILYKALNKQGNQIQSYDLKRVEKLAENKKSIEEEKSSKVNYAFYSDSLLLDHGELELQTGEFTYSPIVYDRRFDGVPVGLVNDLIDIQKEINKRRSKALHLLNSNRIIASGSAYSGWDREKMRLEAGRPDGIFLMPEDAKVEFNNNIDLAKGQLELLQNTDKEMMQVSGLFAEQLGQKTGDLSGVAIKQLQIQSIKNQVHIYDSLRIMKKREGRILLNMLRFSADTNLISFIMKNDNLQEEIILNRVVEHQGKIIIENDVSDLDLDVYVEEVKEYESPAEEQAENLRMLLEMPNGMGLQLLQMPTLMRALGIREPEQIAQEIQASMQGQPQAQEPMVQ